MPQVPGIRPFDEDSRHRRLAESQCRGRRQEAAHRGRCAGRDGESPRIQGCIALENSFNKVGLDHVVLVKVASTAVVAQMLGLATRQNLMQRIREIREKGKPSKSFNNSPDTVQHSHVHPQVDAALIKELRPGLTTTKRMPFT